MRKPEDFQKFYFSKVGLGEGCGCAERIIDVYEFDRKAGPAGADMRLPRRRRSLMGLLRRYGLAPRPKARTE